jgi:hypothetical protein
MALINALHELQEDELCVITTKAGEREVLWNTTAWCFYYWHAGMPVVCPFEEIEEWRPASVKF